MSRKTTLLSAALLPAMMATAAYAEPSDLEAAYYWQAEQGQTAAVETPNVDLAEIAASDPSLTYTEGEDGAPDSMSMLSDVLFEFGDADLAPEALETLDGVAKKLANAEGLRIIGHTDSIGGEKTNLRLGEKRAESVRDWFLAQGYLDSDTIEVESMGEAAPIAENVTPAGLDNAEGRALNRRVEFQIITNTVSEAEKPAELHPTVF